MKNAIIIDNDEVILDDDLAAEWNTTRRTLARYDHYPDGLPFILISNRKYRPVKACRAWLARRVTKQSTAHTR